MITITVSSDTARENGLILLMHLIFAFFLLSLDRMIRQRGTHLWQVEVPAGRWSQLSVHVAGNLFQVFLNRDKLFEVEDGTFSNAGKIGLWTKADSVTYFDDFSIAVTR